MRTIKTIEELKHNIQVIDDYLKSKNEYEVEYAKALVKRGTCFVSVKNDAGYKFYPSRFIGYANNSKSAHEANEYKDGKETNPAISSILNSEPVHIEELEDEYKEYCVSFGLKPNKAGAFGVERKYWVLNG